MSNTKRSFESVTVGVLIRKQINHEFIFRVMRGNGHAGTIAGHLYQHKYTYVVPGSINNAESAASRSALATAVSNWQNVLTQSQKTEYNTRAAKGLHMSGYNLYIREYMLANL